MKAVLVLSGCAVRGGSSPAAGIVGDALPLPTGTFDLAKLVEDIPDLAGGTVETYGRTRDFVMQEWVSRRADEKTADPEDYVFINSNTKVEDGVTERDEVEMLVVEPPVAVSDGADENSDVPAAEWRRDE